MNKFYITTTLPYVNAEPHIGFALEIIQADVIARAHRLSGNEVVFNFGTDEHGLKIYRKAIEKGLSPKEYCDMFAEKFDLLKKSLNLSYTNFIRTTDEHHVKAAQDFWKKCFENGDIYKKTYSVKYCVGCELEKTDSELVEGKCPLHPKQELELIEEENYFFRFSKYQKQLLEHYKNNPDFVKPEGKFLEIKAFVQRGLEDFSISRLKSKMPWGIDVPGDSDHVMYVWFDALINYISTLGWPENEVNFKNYWPGNQVAGVDNLRQQSAIWQAMLMSAGLPPSKQIFIHGFLTLNGQKISKSAGNSIDPIEFVNKYGVDPLRYFLLSKIHPWDNSDFSEEKFIEAYNSDLANGLGNQVSRIAKLCEKTGEDFSEDWIADFIDSDYDPLRNYLADYKFNDAMQMIWKWISDLDGLIEQDQPWKLENKELTTKLKSYVNKISFIVVGLKPFLPDTATKIEELFRSHKITSPQGLFPRIK